MARSGHSTQLTSTSGRHRARQPQTQKLTDNEISELKNYLPEWTSAKRIEKRAVFTTIARAASYLLPRGQSQEVPVGEAEDTAEEWSSNFFLLPRYKHKWLVRRDRRIWSTFEGDVEAMRDESVW
ncbi:hypothetical protein DFJ58DRAFT_730691 [Suillus subalutaceus]|uniref:uncharacterized protein n=1 Tax=Suillus subalutaceus TaxID=48586 RepID=UPI001B87532D|nr:uncharacterized protein DFJ58DRAFT_730691 [Suillus subalutaceus]KAG1846110.1 hypothetical protein DFJ58DRAFT_730691 [Suillus subalutaceus]